MIINFTDEEVQAFIRIVQCANLDDKRLFYDKIKKLKESII